MERAEMDFKSWSRVIDGLIIKIANAEKTAERDRYFLETAKCERARCPAPEKSGKDSGKKNVREV